MSESGDSGEQITVHLRCPTSSDKRQFQIAADATVKQLKELLAAAINEQVAHILLIFLGKKLHDDAKLCDVGIKNESALHYCMPQGLRSPAATSTPSNTPATSSPPTATTVAAPPAAAANPFAAMLGGGGLGGGNMDMGAMQQQMMRDPDMMRQMMNSPIFQSIMEDPNIMQQMITSNPQIQRIVERNPEMGHLLNDPATMRQTMEMMRNPAAFQEMMRQNDRAMGNLSGIPGGEAHLQRMYQDVQEPLLDSVNGSNPFASLSNDTPSRSTAGEQNSAALPDPWAPRQAQQPAAPAAGAGAAANPLGGAGMQGMMQQMMQNPQLMQSLNSRMGSMMGGGAGGQLPSNFGASMQAMMNNPEAMQQATNPRVMAAIQQIQQGMQVLQTEAPALLQQSNNMAAGMAGGNAGGAAGANPMAALMQQFAGANVGGNSAVNAQPPADRFRTQIDQLVSMGFPDREANARALVITNGDVTLAIDQLLLNRN